MDESDYLKDIEKTVEEFVSSNESVDKAIRSLNSLADNFSSQAENGKSTVDQTARSIEDVHSRAASIDEIVEMIKDEVSRFKY